MAAIYGTPDEFVRPPSASSSESPSRMPLSIDHDDDHQSQNSGAYSQIRKLPPHLKDCIVPRDRPLDESGKDDKYISINSELETLMLENQRLTEEIRSLTSQVSRLTDWMADNLAYRTTPIAAENPTTSFSTRPTTQCLDRGTQIKVDETEAKDSPPKIAIPRT
ncbi:hypothetical protein FLONG3_3863 [Fusarium longipes]|uniref:Uncharacterized protein n=1 Tax=Fusarium longipes TaxID=694270 RepID=A0A395T006_9HYPO|nr:hypothetical protein FLONG3_3863 [Fusarium longipes]